MRSSSSFDIAHEPARSTMRGGVRADGACARTAGTAMQTSMTAKLR